MRVPSLPREHAVVKISLRTGRPWIVDAGDVAALKATDVDRMAHRVVRRVTGAVQRAAAFGAANHVVSNEAAVHPVDGEIHHGSRRNVSKSPFLNVSRLW